LALEKQIENEHIIELWALERLLLLLLLLQPVTR